MTSPSRIVGPDDFWASNVLHNLKLTYEAQGMTFFVEPPRDIVPAFLGNYQPDAIALRPEGGVIFELKRGQNPRSEKQLARISERVAQEKGWEFRAIYLSSPADRLPDIPLPSGRELQHALGEVRALAASGHPGPALLAGWSVLEALAHLARAHGSGTASRPLSPLQAVQALAEEGYVEAEAAARLRSLGAVRNAIAHGHLSIKVSSEQVDTLIDDLQSIFSALQAVEGQEAVR